jgi:hypothetical protein
MRITDFLQLRFEKTLFAIAAASAMLAAPVYADNAAAPAPKPLPEIFTKETTATLTQQARNCVPRRARNATSPSGWKLQQV